MTSDRRFADGIWLAVILAAVGCAACGPSSGSAAGDGVATGRSPTLKRIALGLSADPDLHPYAIAPHHRFQPLVQAGLSNIDDRGVLQPVLAEAVPTFDNGLWTLLPDGHMEMTWRLRPEARWHDGTPFTSDDVLFTFEVGQDPELPAFQNLTYRSVESLEAPDALTLTLKWKEPFIGADRLFGAERSSRPLPRHRLGDAHHNNKASFLDLPYWTQEYVGAGPYRIQEWVPGSTLALEAHAGYALGRPRIDEIEVRIVADANAIVASLLSGAFDFASSVASVDPGILLRDQWRDGVVIFALDAGWICLYPQFVDPRPAVVADVRFRRALVHAIDRQALADAIGAGIAPVAHTWLYPNQPEYREIESRVSHYEYDPRLAGQMLTELGYARHPDGIYYDTAGRRLEVELRSGPAEQVSKPADAMSDYWQQLGVSTTRVPTSPQQTQDFQREATFPAFLVRAGPADTEALVSLHSSRARLASNGFRAPAPPNVSRYTNAEMDALIERYRATIPMPERIEVIGEIIRHAAEQVAVAGIYYLATPIAVGNRLMNFTPAPGPAGIIWNAHEWDVRS
jgi:peptide/nickel transport system substrate-binding protein